MFKYNQPMPDEHTQYKLPSYLYPSRYCTDWKNHGLACYGHNERYEFCLRDDGTVKSITYYNDGTKIELESFGDRRVVGEPGEP